MTWTWFPDMEMVWRRFHAMVLCGQWIQLCSWIKSFSYCAIHKGIVMSILSFVVITAMYLLWTEPPSSSAGVVALAQNRKVQSQELQDYIMAEQSAKIAAQEKTTADVWIEVRSLGKRMDSFEEFAKGYKQAQSEDWAKQTFVITCLLALLGIEGSKILGWFRSKR